MESVHQTIVDISRQAAVDYADLIAYTCLGRGLSYRQVNRLSDDFAAWLIHSSGLVAGDRVAIQLPNLLQYPVAALGVFKAGMVVVNVNPLYTPAELVHQLNDSGAKCLLVLANTASNAVKVIAQTKIETVLVTELADLHGPIKRHLINFTIKYIKKILPKLDFPVQLGFRKALTLGRNNSRNNKVDSTITVKLDDLALLQYTGGTTGVIKGAMLSHRNLVSNMLQVKQHLGDEWPKAGAVFAAPLPLYHIYAFSMNMVFSQHMGYHNVLILNPRDTPSLVKALKPFKLNGFVGINTLYRSVCNDADFCSLDFSEMEIASSGGMALSDAIAEQWETLTGCKILTGYGLTETSPFVASASYRNYKIGVVGKLAPATELKIINGAGNILTSANEVGEICIRGPQVMQGYWQQAEETSKVIDSNGWLHTGDLGSVDAEGYLKIVDRLKDLIIVSGFNVYPNEIEEHLYKHPDIVEVAALGVSDDRDGEKVKLFVVSRNPALNAEAVIAYCREGLAAYKVPKLVEFRDSLPKSNIGKVLRRGLREDGKEHNSEGRSDDKYDGNK